MNFEPSARAATVTQVTLVANTALRVLLLNISRRALLIAQKSAGTDVYVGFSQGVTDATGIPLPGVKGANLRMRYSGEVWLYSTGTPTISVTELYQ